MLYDAVCFLENIAFIQIAYYYMCLAFNSVGYSCKLYIVELKQGITLLHLITSFIIYSLIQIHSELNLVFVTSNWQVGNKE